MLVWIFTAGVPDFSYARALASHHPHIVFIIISIPRSLVVSKYHISKERKIHRKVV